MKKVDKLKKPEGKKKMHEKPTDRPTELVACDHVALIAQPIIGHETPHVMLQRQTGVVYICVEEKKVKVLCSSCWTIAVQLPLKH